MKGNAVGGNYLPGPIFAVLLVEHALIAWIGLVFLATYEPPEWAVVVLAVALLAVAVFGLVSSSVSFARRRTSRLWARIASGFGFVVASVVGGGAVFDRFALIREAHRPCEPHWIECGPPYGFDEFLRAVTVTGALFLAFAVVLVVHWFRHLRGGDRP